MNLTAIFTLIQASTPMLKASGHGSIVNVASIYGMVGPDMDIYEDTLMGNPAAYAVPDGYIKIDIGGNTQYIYTYTTIPS